MIVNDELPSGSLLMLTSLESSCLPCCATLGSRSAFQVFLRTGTRDSAFVIFDDAAAAATPGKPVCGFPDPAISHLVGFDANEEEESCGDARHDEEYRQNKQHKTRIAKLLKSMKCLLGMKLVTQMWSRDDEGKRL